MNTPNRVKMMEMVSEGMFNAETVLRDLLNFVSESEAGEFMNQYGYAEDEEDEEEEEEEEEEEDLDS